VPGGEVISIEERLAERRRAERVAHNERAYALRLMVERRGARRNWTLVRGANRGETYTRAPD
jgi:hypothetical protein